MNTDMNTHLAGLALTRPTAKNLNAVRILSPPEGPNLPLLSTLIMKVYTDQQLTMLSMMWLTAL
jgi:hypothetical protein